MRGELELIEDGFDLLPTLSGNGSKIVAVNSGGTALEAVTTTGTGNAVRATSPTLVTPLLGVPTSGTLTNCTGYTDANLSVSDVTTNNSSVSNHGFLKKLSGSSSEFMNGAGNWATPPIGSGTVTSASVVSANGFAGSVANATTTPAITLTTSITGLLKGNGTAISAATAGTDYVSPSSTEVLTNKSIDFGTNTLTMTSLQLKTALSDETGSGAAVFATSPTLVTPILGTPTSGALSNCTAFPLAQLTGGGTGVLTFLATPSSANLAAAITDETGSGALVFANTPTLVTPVLGVATGTSIALSKSGASVDFTMRELGTSGVTYTMKATSTNRLQFTNDSGSATNYDFLNGSLSVSHLLDLSTSTAGQIKVPATANLSSDANTWDDYQEATYTATATGMTTSPTGTFSYTINGNQVVLNIVLVTGTSNTTAFTLTGMPAEARPANTKACPAHITDNGTSAFGTVQIQSTGTIAVNRDASASAWTNSGTKAINAFSVSYTLV